MALEFEKTGKRRDARNGHYRTCLDRVGITDRVCAKGGKASFLRGLPQSELVYDRVLLPDTGHVRVYRLPAGRYDIFDLERKKQILLGQNCWTGSRQNDTYLRPRTTWFYTNATWTGESPMDVSTRDGCASEDGKITVCFGSFGLYRNIFANARQTNRAFSSSSDDIERRRRDSQLEAKKILHDLHRLPQPLCSASASQGIDMYD